MSGFRPSKAGILATNDNGYPLLESVCYRKALSGVSFAYMGFQLFLAVRFDDKAIEMACSYVLVELTFDHGYVAVLLWFLNSTPRVCTSSTQCRSRALECVISSPMCARHTMNSLNLKTPELTVTPQKSLPMYGSI